MNSWLPMQHTYPSTMITPILRRSFPMRARIDKVRIHPISSTHTECDYSAHFHAVQPVRRQSLIHSPPSTRFGPTRPSKYSHSSGRPTTSPFLASLHIARGHWDRPAPAPFRSGARSMVVRLRTCISWRIHSGRRIHSRKTERSNRLFSKKRVRLKCSTCTTL